MTKPIQALLAHIRFVLIIIIFTSLNSTAQEFEWVNSTFMVNATPSSIATDNEGNV
ncbi:MAG: hypothetical protein P8I55_14510 [Crocinitomix sp.]|nr:hypothetical protein [Crocinitomix sp.]